MQTVMTRGEAIPALGFGVFRMSEEEVEQVVPAALEAGIRHFDTAQIYKNEAALGRALARAGVRRDEIFLTTKVWTDNYSPDRFAASVDESLERLQVDRVDLLLAHWPGDKVPVAQQAAWLAEVQAAGKTRLVGVSNYNRAQVSAAAAVAPIVTNQIEVHPYLDQSAMAAAARAADISITAYFAMADGAVPRDPVLQEIGAKHAKSAAQVALRWIVQQGFIVLSKTAKPERVAENAAIFDFALDEADMAVIAGLARADGRIVSPPGLAPDWAA